MKTTNKQIHRGLMTAGAFALTLLTGMALVGASGPKFYKDDPIAVEPESQDASKVEMRKIDLFYDFVLNQFGHPGKPPGARAGNINTIDEVPDSSWFTNRILARPMSVDEAVRGPLTGQGPAAGVLTVIRAKSDGAAPGFTVRDSAGVVWFIAFDPKSNPQAASAAAVIANKIFYALGYHQAEYYISELRRDRLQIDKEAKFSPVSGKLRPMQLKDIDPVLERGAKNADGSYRILASKLLPGKVVGGFKYEGTRSDDPNDLVPHEQRRELRAIQVFGAWTNLVDIKALNTMDTVITENGRTRVRHYLLDIGSAFGIGANGPHDWWEGYENVVDREKMRKRLISMGLYIQPWQTAEYEKNDSIGRFTADNFDPLAWKSRIPAAALLQAREDDTFWAARRVMAFSDEMIRAMVKTGKYSDPAAEKLLANVLIERRNIIGKTYLPRVNPVVNLALSDAGELSFENAAVKAGVAKDAQLYKVAWFNLDNSTGATTPLGETESTNWSVKAPAGLTANAGAYVCADIKAVAGAHESWGKPVRVSFVRQGGGWKLVGLDRMP